MDYCGSGSGKRFTHVCPTGYRQSRVSRTTGEKKKQWKKGSVITRAESQKQKKRKLDKLESVAYSLNHWT